MKNNLQADMEENRLCDTEIEDLDHDVKQAYSSSKWVEIEVACSDTFKSATDLQND